MVNPKKPGGGPDDDDLKDELPTQPFVRRVEVQDEEYDPNHARVIDVRALRAAGIGLDAARKAEHHAVIGVSRPSLEALLTHNSLLELPPEIRAKLGPGAEIELIPLNPNGEAHDVKKRRYGTIFVDESFAAQNLKVRFSATTFLPQVGHPFGFAAPNGTPDYISPVQRIHVLEDAIFLITKSPANEKETIYKLVVKEPKSKAIPSPSLVFKPSAAQLGDKFSAPFNDLRPLREALGSEQRMRRVFRPGTEVLLSKISHEGKSAETFRNKDNAGLIATSDQEEMEADPSLSAVPIVGKKFFIFLANGETIQTGRLKKVTQEEDHFVLTTENDSEYLLTPLT